MRVPRRGLLVAGGLLLVVGVAGCEALQRKFTRKPKHPATPPTPVIQFRDYTHAMTPIERYQKHYLLFDYWNAQLIAALQESTQSPKRLRHNSGEALAELERMVVLLEDEAAGRLVPFVEDRRTIDAAIQRGAVKGISANRLLQRLERQTRKVQAQFYWRDVEDQLKPIE